MFSLARSRCPSLTKALTTLPMLLALTLLTGADGCPLTTDPPSTSGGSSSTASLDIGGASGALWNVTYEAEIRVTLHSGTQSASTSVKPTTYGAAQVLGRTVDLTSFCWRTDVVCPAQVLASQTLLVQSTSTNQFVTTFRRKGPLAGISQQALLGTLDGAQLTVPLEMSPSSADPCTLTRGSGIVATASAPTGETEADSIQGMITLGYAGDCVTLGGNGALYDTDLLQLSMKFSATRAN